MIKEQNILFLAWGVCNHIYYMSKLAKMFTRLYSLIHRSAKCSSAWKSRPREMVYLQVHSLLYLHLSFSQYRKKKLKIMEQVAKA